MNELETIREIVEKIFEVKINNTRNRSVVEAKAAYCYLARQFSEKKLEEIAAEIGLKNHATVIYHAQTNCPDLIETDHEFEWKIQQCKAEIYKLGWIVKKQEQSTIRKYKLAKRMARKWNKALYKLEGKVKEFEGKKQLT